MSDNEKLTQDIAENAAETMLGPNPFVGMRSSDMVTSLISLWAAMAKDPMKLMECQGALLRDLLLPTDTTVKPAPGDKRFADENWTTNSFYNTIMQRYLAWSRTLTGLVDHADVDDITRERARFVLGLIADAAAPTNTLLGNPTALKKTIETRGSNLSAGLSNFLQDMRDNGGLPAQVDKTAFEVGKNLATTPGTVIFRNEVLELIQYTPTTSEVHARPHLLIPPQINKFYVFDLSPEKSLVKFLLENHFQVFLVSWRNPTVAHRDWDVGTYVTALIEAINVIQDVTGSEDVIPHAACSGAITSVLLAAVLAGQKKNFIHAMTLMVAVLGNDADSQLGMFATPDIINAAKREVGARGVLEGQEMGRVFAWMRPNDLVWNYWVNNYLLGNQPPRFDILYWNNDTTRLPAKFHASLLDIMGHGLLLKPNVVKVNDVPIDIGAVAMDKFIVAGTTDHITPWRGVYRMAQVLGGRNDFILSSSGHIQSLVNPPGNAKSKFHHNEGTDEVPDSWLSQAKEVRGSWWTTWADWLRERSGSMVAAPQHPGNKNHPPLGEAPGTYVREN